MRGAAHARCDGHIRLALMLDDQYLVASTYGAMFFGSSSPLGAREIWKMLGLEVFLLASYA